MDRAKLKGMLLAATFQNGVRVSKGKRWGGIALSVVIFVIVAGAVGGSASYGVIASTAAVYAFWVLWRSVFGYPDEFWGRSETAAPHADKVPESPAVDTAQQPVTIVVEKKSSAATWVLVIIVLAVLAVVAFGGCSVVLVPV